MVKSPGLNVGWPACHADHTVTGRVSGQLAPIAGGALSVIKGFHHSAYRCRDSEETRAFYEDFLGCRLVASMPITRSLTGRPVNVLHTYFDLGDGTYIAFFEDRDQPFDFKDQHDFDLHVSLEVDEPTLLEVQQKARARGMECRGVADHGFIRSIYLRDPNGYVVELAVRTDRHDLVFNPQRNGARAVLDEWQARKAGLPALGRATS